jgi:hypothetical protein
MSTCQAIHNTLIETPVFWTTRLPLFLPGRAFLVMMVFLFLRNVGPCPGDHAQKFEVFAVGFADQGPAGKIVLAGGARIGQQANAANSEDRMARSAAVLNKSCSVADLTGLVMLVWMQPVMAKLTAAYSATNPPRLLGTQVFRFSFIRN